MKKRGVAWLLAVLLLLPTAAASETSLEVRSTGGPVKAGEEFEVSVEITGNPTFFSAEYTLVFNREEMTCLDIETGDVLKEAMSVCNPDGPGGAIVAAATVNGAAQDGILSLYHFQAKQDLDSYYLRLTKVHFSDQEGRPIALEARGSGEKEVWFSDIEGHWGEESIRQAAARKLFAGYPDGRFGPDDPVTCAQFITVLYRMSGSPAVTTAAPFPGMENQSEEFRSAVAWGVEQGLISGTGNETFDPDGSLTREAAITTLFSLAGGRSGVESLFWKIYDDYFLDSGEISDWAKPALYWGYYNGLINGTSEASLSPKRIATRVQLSKILISYFTLEEE